jgi:ankyrin repeat protein
MPTPDGVTPLMLALDNDHNDVAKLLLDRGANPQLWDWWGRTALYIVTDRNAMTAGAGSRGAANAVPAFSSVSRMDIVNALLAANVDVNPQLNFHRPSRGGNSGRFIEPLLGTGCTPLMRATIGNPFPSAGITPTSGDAEIVKALLAKGANPNINDMGVTPFLVAAGVNAGNRGGTGLAAVNSGGGEVRVDLMDLLLAHGANVNDQVTGTRTYGMRISRAPSANEGKTALHIAAEDGKVDLVRYLLGKGAKTDNTDADGKRPIDLVKNDTPATAEIRTLLAK